MEQTTCPLCDHPENWHYLSSSDLLYDTPGEFHVVACHSCGHHFVNPRPSLREIGRHYPPDYAPHQAENSAGLESPTASSDAGSLKARLRSVPGLQRFIHRLVDSRAEWIPSTEQLPRRALELGCADGRFLARLQDDGWECTGVEFSPAAAARARNRGLTVYEATLESTALPAASFDAFFAWMVIEHLHDPRAVLREARRILKPGGWLVFSIPNRGCWEPWVFGRYWHAYDLPRHLQHFKPRTIRRLLADCGFTPPKIIHQRSLLNVAGSVGLWLKSHRATSRCGDWLLRFVENPTAGNLLLLAPWAWFFAAIRQGGRLTVITRAAD